MFTGYVRRDVFFSKKFDEYFIITDPALTLQDVLNKCRQTSEVTVYPYGVYTLIETKDTVFAFAAKDKNEVFEPNTIAQDWQEQEKIEKAESGKYDISRQFCIALILILTVLLLAPATAYASSSIRARISDSQEDITPLEGVTFTTGTTTTVIYPAYADHSSGELAFTLRDPRPLGDSFEVRQQNIPSGLSSRFIELVLMYRKAHPLAEIHRITGLAATEAQVNAATQLVLWKHNLRISGTFHVQEASIQDTTVRSLATSIESWVNSQLSVINTNSKLSSVIFQVPSPTLNASSATTVQEGNNHVIGPYTFVSNPVVTLDINVSQGYVVNAARQTITSVTTSEPFYIAIPIQVTSRQTVTLSGTAKEYSLGYAHNRVWLEPTEVPIGLSFSVGTTVGLTGNIQVTIIDSLTGLPMQNIHASIRTDTAHFGTMVTNEAGVMNHEVPLGRYWIDITSPVGFEDYPEFPLTVAFVGDIQMQAVTLLRTDAVVDFVLVDSETFSTVGYAEAFLYKDDQPFKRLAYTNGRVNGVLLSPGNYAISVYTASGGYSISGMIPFSVTVGSNIEVTASLRPQSPLTTIRLETTLNRTNWIFNFHRGSEFLFEMPCNGMLQVSFPPGDNIQVIARSADNTVYMAPFDFVAGMVDTEVIIPVVVGTETVTFTIVDNNVYHPIPYVILGLFDQNHNLLDIQTANHEGRVRFTGLVYGSVYYVNVVAAPPAVSGYAANGNRFIGRTRDYQLQLYSYEDIRQYTQVDTIWRLPAVVYNGPEYTYPRREDFHETTSVTPAPTDMPAIEE